MISTTRIFTRCSERAETKGDKSMQIRNSNFPEGLDYPVNRSKLQAQPCTVRMMTEEERAFYGPPSNGKIPFSVKLKMNSIEYDMAMAKGEKPRNKRKKPEIKKEKHGRNYAMVMEFLASQQSELEVTGGYSSVRSAVVSWRRTVKRYGFENKIFVKQKQGRVFLCRKDCDA